MEHEERLKAALADRYQIEREIGSGGMATVYLAQDLKHARKVAVKVLRPELAAVLGAERFLSEIKTTANLQHPHILPLFDSGEAHGFLFYVMPYVEGESLRARLDREKQLSVEESVGIAKSVASALDYAHRHGVIHRDIKPANILLHDGQPMVADFGIALAVRAAGGERLTETGLSLGTPQYMSPEQASGDREVDGRSDIYSLGCVLYEMLTGEPPHGGPTVQAIIAKLLTDKPRPVTELRDTVPVHVAATVHKALEKLPADRFGGAGEFAVSLEDTSASWPTARQGAGPGVVPDSKLIPRWAFWALLTIICVLLATNGWSWTRFRGNVRPTQVEKFLIDVPSDIEFLADDDAATTFALSHDGSFLVYTGVREGQRQLFLRRLDEWDPIPIAGTEGARTPFLSPDGELVGFISEGGLFSVPVTGGERREIRDIGGMVSAVSWGTHDSIIFSLPYEGLFQIPETGGDQRQLTALDTAAGEVVHTLPQVLPDGTGVLYTIGFVGDIYLTAIQEFGEDERTILSEEARGLGPRYVTTGAGEFLLTKEYGAGELNAVRFDLARRQVQGDRFRVLEGLHKGLFDGGNLGVSGDGTLAYLSGTADLRFVWVDRQGNATPLPIPPRPFRRPRLSPDGTRIAVEEPDGDQNHIYVYNLQGQRARLTEEGSNTNPTWGPDGELIAFATGRSEPGELFARKADRTGQAWRVASPQGAPVIPLAWASTGVLTTGGGWDIWILDLDGDSVPKRHFSSDAREVAGTISPDGRWIAYGSDRSGRSGDYEIFVAEFPGSGEGEQVTLGGGRAPVWSKDSSELFFRKDKGIWSVRMPSAPGLPFEEPEHLFDGDFIRNPGNLANYDVAPDGRFLMMVPDSVPNEFRIIKGWDVELARIAGGGP
ncbi:MAG: protein kinase [Gemmatimonadota bacterium]|jgi:serine/threonine-protein kinase